MSERARAARRLASLLTGDSGVHVAVQYDRTTRRYVVVWEDGPPLATMYAMALEHEYSVPLLDVDAMDWRRTDRLRPHQPGRS
ncbi:hypothetical protein [Kibdelosporangium phytohabitans]|uniref:hypothetical protein n=1 Tax=Kibdelosporangium phytohabitans TaxID=860235 RepID=UPI0012FC5478|nr:hypothetical protein [Kibdelosporangium phytohabitans]MBE1471359.1 hypothetical protein [Kibdelosporangium phytohabitans]